jgi:hypothetical protein
MYACALSAKPLATFEFLNLKKISLFFYAKCCLFKKRCLFLAAELQLTKRMNLNRINIASLGFFNGQNLDGRRYLLERERERDYLYYILYTRIQKISALCK